MDPKFTKRWERRGFVFAGMVVFYVLRFWRIAARRMFFLPHLAIAIYAVLVACWAYVEGGTR